MTDLKNVVEIMLKGAQTQAARQILEEKGMLTNLIDTDKIIKHIGDYRYRCVLDQEAETSYICPVHQVFGKTTGLVRVPEDHKEVNAMMDTLVIYMENEFSGVQWHAYR